MKLLDAVSNRIMALCEERNITVNKLGNDCGIDPSTITSIFYGKSKNPGLKTIKSICDGLNITMYEFFNDELFRTQLFD